MRTRGSQAFPARALIRLLPVLLSAALCTGCPYSEDGIFNQWAPNYFTEPPADLGPFGFQQQSRSVPDGADGQPLEMTLFVPSGAQGPNPAMFWVTGSNQVAYYHQSLHETLASWGYVVIVPTTRPLVFADTQYHRRNVDLIKQSIELARNGQLGFELDEQRIATGGHSIAGTMALLVAGEEPDVDTVVLWAPTDTPVWQGLTPEPSLAQVTQPVLYLLAELDILAPPGSYPTWLRQATPGSQDTEFIIQGGRHLYFQQPTGADIVPELPLLLTRFQQQTIAIERTRAYLDQQFGISRD